MKALLLKKNQTYENGNGYPVVQIVEDDEIFEVHNGLMWVDCQLTVDDTYNYHYNVNSQEFIINVLPPPPEANTVDTLTEIDINALL